MWLRRGPGENQLQVLSLTIRHGIAICGHSVFFFFFFLAVLEVIEKANIYFNPKMTEKASFLSGLKYEHFVAGLTAGIVPTLITHPLDLIKLRFAGMLYLLLASFPGD